MLQALKFFILRQISTLKKEEGLGTIEMVILIAILVGLAILFKGFIFDFFGSMTENIKQPDFSLPTGK